MLNKMVCHKHYGSARNHLRHSCSGIIQMELAFPRIICTNTNRYTNFDLFVLHQKAQFEITQWKWSPFNWFQKREMY